MKRIYILIIMTLASTALAGSNSLFMISTNGLTNGLGNLPFQTNFEQRFLSQAAIGNLQEIMLGQLAETNSQNTNVQNFGTLLVLDHSAAQDQLQMIATNLGITLPSTNARTQVIVNRLSALSGIQFDSVFIPFMVQSHIQDIQRYEAAALRAPDLEVRDYARTNLPVLMDHLVVALTIRETLLTNQPAFTGITGTNGPGNPGTNMLGGGTNLMGTFILKPGMVSPSGHSGGGR